MSESSKDKIMTLLSLGLLLAIVVVATKLCRL